MTRAQVARSEPKASEDQQEGRRNGIRRAVRVSLALSWIAWAGFAAADPPAPDAQRADPLGASWAPELSESLMSPFCPGRPLADCTSPDAARLRLWIGVQAAAGRTRGDVEQELYARYGEEIRGTPKVEGFGAAAYGIPVLVFLAGGGLVAWFLRRATRRAPPPVSAVLDPELDRRLDEVLSR